MNKKVYESVINGNADNNIGFVDFKNLIIALGFELERQKGSHTIYHHAGINEYVNIQPDGSKAKGYQVKQLRGIISEHGL